VSHPILSRLASTSAEERRRACLEVAGDPCAVLLVPALAEALGDASNAVARAASRSLAALGRQHAAVGEALRESLRAQEPRRRIQAAFTLARLEPPEPRSLPALVAALDSEAGDVRWMATRILVEMGRLHGEVLRVLMNLAADGSPRVRRMALCALRELAPGEPEVARTLLAASRDADLGVRRAALTALAALEEPPPAVRERLVETAASDPDAASRRLAEVALDLLGSARPVADAP
jgi:HEAT repeat protein